MSEYYYLGAWDNKGVPTYLEPVDDVISPELLQRIDVSLPNNKPVPQYNPQYLSNTINKNIIIRTSDEMYTGADIYMTFIDEAAGYINVCGYYVYTLNDTNIDVPTKLVNGTYVACTPKDMEAVDSNGKYIINKTIVFPNASLLGDKGGLKSGNKVKLVYDHTNTATKFPNNTGIGFFLIPNGWDRTNNVVVNRNARVYSDHIFNNSAIEGGSVQTVMLYDAMNSDTEKGKIILGFEDITRPAGDSDFNDAIVMLTCTPAYIYDYTKSIVLPNSSNCPPNSMVADKTGIYLNLDANTISAINSNVTQDYRIEHKIIAIDKYHTDIIKKLFDSVQFENNGTVEYSTTDLDINGYPIAVILKCIIRNNLKNYNYIFMSINNKSQTSPLDDDLNVDINNRVKNIVRLQDYYINGGSNIIGEDCKVKKNTTNEQCLYYDKKIDTSTTHNPYSMGDPHITTIHGVQYKIDDIDKIYELYNDGELKIYVKNNYYAGNKGCEAYENLTFMNYLYISNNKNKLVIDLFEDKYYSFDNINDEIEEHNQLIKLPIGYEIVAEESYDENLKTKINDFNLFGKKTDIDFKYIKFSTRNMGSSMIEIITAPHVKDFINSVSLISNGLLFNDAIGAFISEFAINTY